MNHIKTVPVTDIHSVITTGMQSSDIIIDVRSPLEYQAKHFKGAQNIPLENISKHIEKLNTYKKI